MTSPVSGNQNDPERDQMIDTYYREHSRELLIESFNGKPQATSPVFAYAFGSPLNEDARCSTGSTSDLLHDETDEPHAHCRRNPPRHRRAHSFLGQVGKCLGNCARFACHSEQNAKNLGCLISAGDEHPLPEGALQLLRSEESTGPVGTRALPLLELVF